MCLKISNIFKTRDAAQKFSKTPLVASSNMVVYKMLDKHEAYTSPHHCIRYFPGETKSVKKFSFAYVDACGWRVNVNKGLHSYSKDRSNVVYEKHTETLKRYNRVLIKCIIPKGTPYFTNKEGEYVSLKLQMPGEYKDMWENK